MKVPRKPDFKVSTPSQIDASRWVVIGSAWHGATEHGVPYINVHLDVMPTSGKLSLFPLRDKDDK